MASLNLGEVEDVVDQLEQMPRALLDVSHEAFLLARELNCALFGE